MQSEVSEQQLRNDPEVLQLQHLLKRVGERYNLPPQNLLSTLEQDFFLPVTIFTKDMSPLETVCRYCKEICSYSNKEIAALLQRSEKTTSQAYRSSLLKHPKPLVILPTSHSIPLQILKGRNLSMSEIIVKYMKEKLGMKYVAIARELQRDPRTIWTIYHRSHTKGEGK